MDGDLEHKLFEDEDRRDSLSPARGILIGLLIALGVVWLPASLLYFLL